jgi:hypothetical protein
MRRYAIGASAVLSMSILAGLAAGQEPTEPEAPRPQPPTEEEAQSWEQAFLAEEEPETKAMPAAKDNPGSPPGIRLVSLYGAARGFGVIGRSSVDGAARKLKRKRDSYRRVFDKPVDGAFDLVSVIATRCGSGSSRCRIRVSDSVVTSYLRRVRNLGGRLILDVQPGRSDFLWELDHLRKWLRKPDVHLAIDPEWNVGPDGRPGDTQGSVGAGKINDITRELAKIVKRHNLPEKLLVVHEFHKRSIREDAKVRERRNVDVVQNFDGIGSPRAKRAAYRQLSTRRLFNGFSIFYKLDTEVMGSRAVRRLSPRPHYVMYQ